MLSQPQSLPEEIPKGGGGGSNDSAPAAPAGRSTLARGDWGPLHR